MAAPDTVSSPTSFSQVVEQFCATRKVLPNNWSTDMISPCHGPGSTIVLNMQAASRAVEIAIDEVFKAGRLTRSQIRLRFMSQASAAPDHLEIATYLCRVFFLDLPLLNDVRERVWDLLPFTRYIVPCDQDMEAEILAEELKDLVTRVPLTTRRFGFWVEVAASLLDMSSEDLTSLSRALPRAQTTAWLQKAVIGHLSLLATLSVSVLADKKMPGGAGHAIYAHRASIKRRVASLLRQIRTGTLSPASDSDFQPPSPPPPLCQAAPASGPHLRFGLRPRHRPTHGLASLPVEKLVAVIRRWRRGRASTVCVARRRHPLPSTHSA
ncbi:uncharacterized protein EHS24_005713 [Apiotrichum porosum]|uniref:Uncharacterized protein n=1 Tax=Apiotrichum porosum TaxID=105984 RepID=A0A427XZ80_9TREE|nr:uncharacterized protein EHS24_005713 [Apiotrichum porosum]RSH84204.1 hypothetical protein EHS24_005713 [Apiotrichum porosum]